MWCIALYCDGCKRQVYLPLEDMARVVASILAGSGSVAPCDQCEAKKGAGLVVPNNAGKLTRLPYNRPDGLR